MQVYCRIPGVRIDVPFWDEKTKKGGRKPIIFESPDKAYEVPDEIAKGLIATLPKVYSENSFEPPKGEPVVTPEVKTEIPEEQPVETVQVPKKKKK